MDRNLVDTVRRLIVRSLRLARAPESIPLDANLFGEKIGLDSVDAVQLVTSIEKHFHIHLSDSELARQPLMSVRSIADLLASRGVVPSKDGESTPETSSNAACTNHSK
jgi:acyl carrier protein